MPDITAKLKERNYFESSYFAMKEVLYEGKEITQEADGYTFQRRRHQWNPRHCLSGIKHRYEIKVLDSKKRVIAMHRTRDFDRSYAFWMFCMLPFIDLSSHSTEQSSLVKGLKESIRADHQMQRRDALYSLGVC